MPYSKGAKRTMRRYGRKRSNYRKKSAVKVSSSVKKYVRKAIHKQIENKSTFVSQTISFGSVLESSDLNMYPILWYPAYHTLANGVLDGNRIGNRVNIRKVYLRYALFPLPYDVGTNPTPVPTHIQLMLLRTKQNRSALVNSTDLGRLFQSGGSAYGPSGTLLDLNSSLNRDYFDANHCKIWSHKLSTANIQGSGGQLAYQTFANNDFKLNHVKKMDITKMFQKTVIFDDGQYVQNGNVSFGFQSIASNNSATGATILNARIQYTIEIIYEDA